MTDAAERGKAAAARRALDFVEPGMTLGLGTGSTAVHFVRALGARVRQGLRIVGVATSGRTAELARELSIPLAELDEVAGLDLTVDGADELDRELRLIKGGGGALLREKLVALASARMVVIADRSKLVTALGAFPLPLEILPFGHRTTMRRIEAAIGAFITGEGAARLRLDAAGAPFVTEGGHYIVDIACGRLLEPEALADFLDRQAGVVEHGLFIALASAAVLGGGDGAEVIELPRR